MRRFVVVAVLLLSLAGCGKDPHANSVSHVVRYELNMKGQRAFADLSASYTNAEGFLTGVKTFAASWSKEVTVSYPDVDSVRVDASFRFDTSVPGESNDYSLSMLRCRIFVDGVEVDNKVSAAPSCTYRLTREKPSPVPSAAA
jgi:hypothetical protein